MRHLKQLALFLKLDLQRLILILIILCVSCLFGSSIFILNHVIKAQLIENSLSVNEKYASKIALSTDQNTRASYKASLFQLNNRWCFQKYAEIK